MAPRWENAIRSTSLAPVSEIKNFSLSERRFVCCGLRAESIKNIKKTHTHPLIQCHSFVIIAINQSTKLCNHFQFQNIGLHVVNILNKIPLYFISTF